MLYTELLIIEYSCLNALHYMKYPKKRKRFYKLLKQNPMSATACSITLVSKESHLI